MSDKVLVLGGETMRCVDVMPIGMAFDLAEAVDSGSEMRAIATIGRTLKALVVEEDRPRLEAVLHRSTDVVTFADLNRAMGDLMVQYSGRPTAPPSASQGGSARTDGTRRVVSLSRGTVREDETSSRGGASRAS